MWGHRKRTIECESFALHLLVRDPSQGYNPYESQMLAPNGGIKPGIGIGGNNMT